MDRALIVTACIAVLVLVLPAAAQEQKSVEGVLEAKKAAIPSAAEQKSAIKKVRDTYATDYKSAKAPEQKWNLAVKLAKAAVEIRDDPKSEYAFATEAIDLYVGVGDALSAFRAVDELAMTFDINPIKTKSDLFRKAAKEAKVVALKRSLALVGLKLAGDAAAAEEYVIAKEVAALSLSLAKPSQDPSVVKRATEQLGRYADLLKRWLKVSAARETLKADPKDPDANEMVGLYLCLERQNWDEGLPFLAKGFDQELTAYADIDLKTPNEAAAQASIANLWWELAEKKKAKDTEKQQFMPRVAYWYEKALPGLSGIPKTEAEKRLEAAYEAMSGRSFSKILQGPANGIQSLGTLDCQDKAHPADMGKAFDYRRSWLLSLQFNPPHLNGGWHMVMFWGDGRGGRDPLWLRQDGPWLHCVVEDAVNERGQGISALLTANQVNEWVDVKFVHDAVSQELELYLNHRLVRKEALAITPQPDQEMNVVLGGTNDYTSQRFTGKVRNVWMGNIR